MINRKSYIYSSAKRSLFALSLASLQAVAAPANSDSYSGDLNSGSAGSWARPFADGTCCSSLGPVSFLAQDLLVGMNGSYSISSIQNGYDGYLFIYSDSFSPTDPTTNFVAGDDDGNGGIGTSDIDAVPLVAGTRYIIVDTGFAAGDKGTFTTTVSGPGSISFILFNPEEALSSLLATNQGIASTFATTNLIVNGAHSRPMSRYVAAKQKTFWVAGDFGTDNYGSRHGNIGLGEFGTGYNYGPFQLNLAIGQTWADQKLIDSGGVDTDGKYLMLEGIIPIDSGKGVYATLGTYRLWGELDIKRGYLNGGVLDSSSASPYSKSWGIRARVDWVDALAIQSTNLSPYVNLSYSQTSLNAYTETGGGFPAQFDKRNDEITELRIGANSATAFGSGDMNFVANLEAVHRFNDKASNATGEVIGTSFSFDIAGDHYERNWFKAGVGVEGKLGEGKLSAMLNGTDKGENSDAWLAVSYAMAF
ncbi:autotransporter outer membrane beta-barrel domain-containing protein [uncultured Amphritea sp.]|uniref:autotransporter outer membrane beta-barrel domain-containing protein n=1 Tax=uncultured Amphritea sp. TaxID=981605 RepID=UPI002634B739|nr:autotransporter outer membrane beta-barrel domain-containing protein [uncultured Amphritea sp.]